MNIAAELSQLAADQMRLQSLLSDALRDPLSQLDQRLRSQIGPHPIDCLCADLFSAGGKRLRAATAIVVSDATRVSRDLAVRIAEIVELTHGATLLHDDVIDEADERRGSVAARRRWTNTLSVLGGDFLLLRSLELAASIGVPDVAAAHRAVLHEVLASEVAQLSAQRSGDLSIPGYMTVASGKTGSLFAFACGAPALCSGDRWSFRKLQSFGMEFGIAFQVADDIRDIRGTDRSKPCGLDLSDGVPSLPLRIAADSDPEMREALRAFAQRAPSPREVKLLITKVLAGDAIPKAAQIGRSHLKRGLDALDEVSFVGRLTPLRVACTWLQGELAQPEVQGQ